MEFLHNLPLKGLLLKVLVSFLALYFLFSPLVLGSVYDKLLFYPDTNSYPEVDEQLQSFLKSSGLIKEDVYINLPNKNKLHAWFLSKPNAKCTFLISHGNGGNIYYRLYLIKALAPYGSILLYDYEGYGDSDGEPSRKGICLDGLAAYDYLIKQKSIDANEIILFGESLGCGVSCEISKNRKAAALILQSGWTSLLDVAREKLAVFKLFPNCFFRPPYFDNRKILMGPHPPLLLIHGEKDNILPCRYAKINFADASEPKELLLLPNASHNDVGAVDSELYLKGIDKFMRSLLQRN